MYVYLITNLINQKKYVGITNDYKKRWANKASVSNNQVITKAILKYGKENFSFEVLYSNIPLEEIDDLEIKTIQEYQSLVPNGYNVAKGGRYGGSSQPKYGADNSNACLTEEEAKYIKSHRDQPEMVLYEEFSEKITYRAFKNIYHDITYKNIKPTVEEYPYNFEFGCQFAGGNLTYNDVVEIRKMYSNGVYWKIAFEKYKDLFENEWSFWNMYYGNTYKLVMPEVFTKENRFKHSSLANQGINNGRAKMTEEDVLKMRKMWNQRISRKEIQQFFSQYTRESINCVLRGETWKYLL